VPPHQSLELFAQAMRAIGEPIHGRPASEISMADLLGQLFAYTEVFDMETRPELILLQKTMVVVEGVARSLDPEINLWTAAEPIAREWIEQNAGVAGALRDAGAGAGTLGRVLSEAPRFLEQFERTALALAGMAREGFRLDEDTVERLAAAEARHNRWTRWALWLAALALAAIALRLVLPAG
jgi:ubiquinone biosynthesis protein